MIKFKLYFFSYRSVEANTLRHRIIFKRQKVIKKYLQNSNLKIVLVFLFTVRKEFHFVNNCRASLENENYLCVDSGDNEVVIR